MNRTKSVLNYVYIHRRKVLVVFMMILIIPIFQNCAGGFSTGAQGGSDASSMSSGGTDTGAGGGTGGGTGGSTGPTLDQIQKACKALISTPSLSAPSMSSVTSKSGLGAAESGDEKTPAMISITSNRGVADAAAFSAGNCDAQFSLQLDCTVVEGDSSRPISVTNAVSAAGANLMSSSQATLAKNSFSMNNCSAAFAVGSNSVNFSIKPNTTAQRCTEGTFTVKLTARNAVTGQGTGFTSAPQYLSVHMSNTCWSESKLIESSGNLPAVGNFGTAVAINGSWSAVVSPTDDAGAVLDVGAVRMYKLEGSAWNYKQTIQIATAQARDTISSVAINGSRMIIGSPSPYVGGQGNAYYYTLSGDTWVLSRQISPPVSQADQAFGQVVAINSSQVFISAPGFNSGGMTKAGVVYVYNSDGSALSQALTGATASYAAFGTSLAVDGSMLAAGAPQAIGREAQGNGQVFVYSYSSTWTQVATKTGSMAAETFGSSVALYGNRLAVGSPNYASGTNSAQGRAYIYNSYSDAAAAKTINGQATGDRLGAAVGLSNVGAYIAAPGVNTRSGKVDFYQYSDYSLYFRLIPYSMVTNSDFGNALAVSGNNVVVGSRIRSDPNDNSGAAFIYQYK